MPRLLFEKKGNAVWISHLDLMRICSYGTLSPSRSKSSSSQLLSIPTERGSAIETEGLGLNPWVWVSGSPARLKAR